MGDGIHLPTAGVGRRSRSAHREAVPGDCVGGSSSALKSDTSSAAATPTFAVGALLGRAALAIGLAGGRAGVLRPGGGRERPPCLAKVGARAPMATYLYLARGGTVGEPGNWAGRGHADPAPLLPSFPTWCGTAFSITGCSSRTPTAGSRCVRPRLRAATPSCGVFK